MSLFGCNFSVKMMYSRYKNIGIGLFFTVDCQGYASAMIGSFFSHNHGHPSVNFCHRFRPKARLFKALGIWGRAKKKASEKKRRKD